MSDATATTTPRTVTISRRGFSLAVALLLGTMVVPSVEAAKKGKNTIASIKKRVGWQVDGCEAGGGTATVDVRPGGTSVSCSGGAWDGSTCVNSSKRTRCYQARTSPPPDPGPPAPPPEPPTPE